MTSPQQLLAGGTSSTREFICLSCKISPVDGGADKTRSRSSKCDNDGRRRGEDRFDL